MSFKDIRGQESAISFLVNSFENKRLSHAYIFSGPAGVGKKLTAVSFAKAINCASYNSGSSCDVCPSCRKIDSSNHPDVVLLKSHKIGAQIKIDQIRALIKDVGLKPYEALRKVYIIDDAETMTQEAQGALLKTLEEPPSDSVIILITRTPAALFPTIRSRSQSVRFFPLTASRVKEILIREHGADEVRAHVLSGLSAGRLGEALNYHKEKGFFDKRQAIVKSLANETFMDSDFDKIGRAELKSYLDIILTWYRDILVVKAGMENTEAVVNIDRMEAILLSGKSIELEHLQRIIAEIISTSVFLDQNANPKLAMGVLAAVVGNG